MVQHRSPLQIDLAGPLRQASMKGHTRVVNAFLEKRRWGTSRNDKVDETALSLAFQNDHMNTMVALVRHRAGLDDVHVLSDSNSDLEFLAFITLEGNGKSFYTIDWNPLSNLVFSKDYREALELLRTEAVNIADCTACVHSRLPTTNCKGLLVCIHYANIEVFSNDRKSPFHAASTGSWAHMEGHLDILNLLLRHKADPNIRESGGRTPLHDAASRDYAHIVEALLIHNADPEVRDDIGQTALHKAWGKGDDAAAIFLEYGADPYATDDTRKTPVDVAVQNGYMRLYTTVAA